MNTVSQSVVKERREEILAVALTCFGEKGFVDTRMTDIASRSGMSVGNLYNYFKNKDAIVEALANREIALLNKKIRKAQEAQQGKQDHLCALKEVAATRLKFQNAVFAIDVMRAAIRNPRLGEILHRFDSSCRQMLLDAYIQGGVCNPEQRLELDMCLFDGLTIRILANPTLDVDRLAENVAHRIVHSTL